MKIKDFFQWSTLFFTIWFISLCSGIWIFVYNYFSFIQWGIKTTATVTNVEEIRTSQRKNGYEKVKITYKPTLNFNCWNEKNITRSTKGSSNLYDYDIWEKISIYCKEGESDFLIAWDHFIMPSFLIVFGLIFASIIFLTGDSPLIRNWKRNKYKKIGVFKQLPITDIIESSASIRGKRGLVLCFKDESFEYKSENFFFDVGNYIEQNEVFKIYYDPQNPVEYWIDTDHIYEKAKCNIIASTPIQVNSTPEWFDTLGKEQLSILKEHWMLNFFPWAKEMIQEEINKRENK